MPTDLIDLCDVGKGAPIQMTRISIKLNKYSLRYYSLKSTHKNGHNFWNNLITYVLLLQIKTGVAYIDLVLTNKKILPAML